MCFMSCVFLNLSEDGKTADTSLVAPGVAPEPRPLVAVGDLSYL